MNLIRISLARGKFGKKHSIILAGLLGVFLGCSDTSFGQLYVSLNSTTDGAGLFSYTFSRNNSGYVWAPGANQGLYLESHGILEIISPPGWTATVDINDFISWRPPSTPVFFGEPSLTFSVRSSYTGAVTYNDPLGSGGDYQRGAVVGAVYTYPDHTFVAGGYETFAYLGPQIVPEPSGFALFVLTALLVALVRKVPPRAGASRAQRVH